MIYLITNQCNGEVLACTDKDFAYSQCDVFHEIREVKSITDDIPIIELPDLTGFKHIGFLNSQHNRYTIIENDGYIDNYLGYVLVPSERNKDRICFDHFNKQYQYFENDSYNFSITNLNKHEFKLCSLKYLDNM